MTVVTAASSRTGARVVWVIAALGVADIGVLIATYGIQARDATTAEAIAALSLVGSMLAFILSGALIVSRQPRNIVGWRATSHAARC